MDFPLIPLTVTCDTCGESAETYDGLDPDSALVCGCCLVPHNHAGRGCRTITIRATAFLRLLDVNDLMEAAGTEALPDLPVESGHNVQLYPNKYGSAVR